MAQTYEHNFAHLPPTDPTYEGLHALEWLRSLAQRPVPEHCEVCAACYYQWAQGQAARAVLEEAAAHAIAPTIARWEHLVTLWYRDSKFYRLWYVEKKAGRDPLNAFREQGWEA